MNAVAAAEVPSVADFARTFRHVQAQIHKVIVGHQQAVEELLSALFAGGHVLIEGVPGTEDAGVEPIFSVAEAAERIEGLKRLVREVMVAQPIEHYAARMVRATQPSSSRYIGAQSNGLRVDAVDRYVSFGASPRGAQALIMGAKVRALLDGRANVAYDDIDQVAPAALQHRVM